MKIKIKKIFSKIKKPKLHMTRTSKSFNVNESHDKLNLFLIFVKKGHGDHTNDLLLKCGISMTTMMYAFGTKTTYAKDIFGGEEKNKEAILAVVPENKLNTIQEALAKRFQQYPASQGVVLLFDVKSLAGILAYKYLADYEGAEKYEGSK